MIHTVKGSSVVNEAEVGVFMKFLEVYQFKVSAIRDMSGYSVISHNSSYYLKVLSH